MTLVKQLPSGQYNIVLRVADNQGLEQENTVLATVCDCAGTDVVCTGGRVAAVGLPMILGILGAILLLLCKSDHCQYLRSFQNPGCASGLRLVSMSTTWQPIAASRL